MNSKARYITLTACLFAAVAFTSPAFAHGDKHDHGNHERRTEVREGPRLPEIAPPSEYIIVQNPVAPTAEMPPAPIVEVAPPVIHHKVYHKKVVHHAKVVTGCPVLPAIPAAATPAPDATAAPAPMDATPAPDAATTTTNTTNTKSTDTSTSSTSDTTKAPKTTDTSTSSTSDTTKSKTTD